MKTGKQQAERIEQACKEIMIACKVNGLECQLSYTIFNQVEVALIAKEYKLREQLLWDIMGADTLNKIKVK